MTETKKTPREPLPRGFWIIWSTVALDMIGFGMVAPILGRYADRFGASGFQVGMLFASFSLAQMIFDTVRRANIAIESGDTQVCAALATAVHEMCNALGLMLRSGDDVDEAIVERAQQLDAARVAKDFAMADAIRIELQAAGYVVETTKAGTRVRRA